MQLTIAIPDSAVTDCTDLRTKTEKIFQKLKTELIKSVTLIIDQLKSNPQADISFFQEKIDSLVFEWFGFTEKDRGVVEGYIKQMKEERELY